MGAAQIATPKVDGSREGVVAIHDALVDVLDTSSEVARRVEEDEDEEEEPPPVPLRVV